MYIRKCRRNASILTAMIVTCALAPLGAAEPIYLVTAHDGIEVFDTADFANRPKAVVDKVLSAKAVTFNLTYLDGNSNVGFGNTHVQGPTRRARLEQALVYVADTLEATGTIDVEVRASETDASGALASAGTFFSGAAGYQNGSAFTRLTTGVKPFGGTPEIFVTVDFGYPWNATTNPPGSGEFDLLSVLIHEVTHGMGILSLASASGAGALQGLPQTYSVFDRFIRRASTGNILFDGPLSAIFTGTASDLISNNLDWDGTAATAAYGGRPPVNAPGTFQSGSSLSHWASSTGAIMTPSIANGVQKRTYQPFEIAAFADLGWPVTLDVPDAIAIAGPTTVEIGDAVTLTAFGADGTYQWYKDFAPISGADDPTLVFDPVIADDSGIYTVTLDTGAKEIITSAPFVLNVVPMGSLPIAGLAGLALLGAGCAAAGTARMRRR